MRIQRFVKGRHDQDGGVYGLDVVQEDQSGAGGVQPGWMVIVVPHGEARCHGE